MSEKFPSPDEIFQDRYRIQSVINRGGFGRVYRATQVEINRDVAIKVLQPVRREGADEDKEAARLEVVAKRFEREAQVVSQLRDSHTVMMYDYGTTSDGLLYMVLEYVKGEPLSDVIRKSGPLSAERAVKIARQVCMSLQEAHALTMLHRDIKPQNIMLFEHVGRKDQVKVLDFGLAKSTQDGSFQAEDPDLTGEEVILGTPRYMSPEQIRGDELTPATDIYSLGLVMYEMLTGEKAVTGDSAMNTLARHLNNVPIVLPESTQVPDSLRETVNAMLQKSVSKRITNIEDLIERLDDWDGSGEGVYSDELRKSAFEFNAVDRGNKQRLLLGVVGGLVGFFLLVGLLAAVMRDGGDAAANPAEAKPDSGVGAVVAEVQVEPTREDPVVAAAEDVAPEQPVEEAGAATDPAVVEDAGVRELDLGVVEAAVDAGPDGAEPAVQPDSPPSEAGSSEADESSKTQKTSTSKGSSKKKKGRSRLKLRTMKP